MTGPRVSHRTKILLAILAAALIAFIAFFGDVRAAYQAGRVQQAMDDHDWQQALALLDRFPEKSKESAHWHFLQGRIARRSGNHLLATAAFDRAASLGWREWDIARQRLLAKAQLQIGEAEDELKQIVTSGVADEEAEEIYEAMSQGYLSSMRLADAARSLKFWSEWQPQNPVPHLWMGDLHKRLENPDAAILEFEAAVKCDPEHVEARLKLAQLRLEQLQIEPAAELFKQCQVGEFQALATLGLAECLRRQGAHLEAKSLLHEALIFDLPPEQQAEALSALGQVALEEQEYAQAAKILGDAVAIDPNIPASRLALATALTHMGQTARADVERKTARQIIDRHNRLVGVTRQVLQQPQNADLRCEAGQILLEQGMTGPGVMWLQTALQLDPDHRAAHETLAAHFRSAGDEARARQHELHTLKESRPGSR